MSSLLRDRRSAIVVLVMATIGAGAYALARRAETASRTTEAPHDTGAETSRRASERSGAAVATPPSPTEVGSRVRTTAAALDDDASAAVDHVAALRRGLASPDEATRIAAVEAAVSATAVETLGDLEKFELARDPEAAPTVIHALALLGASAEGTKRDDAASTLERWLRDETRREGPDVPGNVSNIVEALGDVGGRNAVDALGAMLDRAEVALHVQTLAVMKLGELGDSRARPPVERFAKRVAALPHAEDIDEELRVEAIEAAHATLSKI